MPVQQSPPHPWRRFALPGSGKSKKGKRAKVTRPANRREKIEPCEYLMQRLRAEFGLEFIHAKLSDRGRFKVLDYAKMMLRWEEAGPKKVREINRLLAKKGPGLLSRKFPALK